ncbi:MAG: hypothetical protein GF418_10270 [Chitinivibrionales bacterium]|nr:hypothetical protein [Chitinivibrionales bacterium]MBD3395998.1 hypothetical protein [Chitinivibrionales bacterium]
MTAECASVDAPTYQRNTTIQAHTYTKKEQTMNPVRIGFVGTGWIADWHFDGIKTRDECTVVGGCDSPDRFDFCKKRCEEWGIRPYARFEDMLADETIDALYILTPTHLHHNQTLRAIEAGKHVLVEKPVALSQSDIDDMKLAGAERGIVVFPAHNFVYRPVVRKAKEILDTGALGTISYALFRAVHFIPDEASVGWRTSLSASGGGAMIDSGTHLVYQSLHLMGDPARLSAFKAKKHYTKMDSEDICQISLQYEDGAIGNIMQSWASGDTSSTEIRIQGDKGNLLISDALYHNGEKVAEEADYGCTFAYTAAAFAKCATEKVEPVSNLDDAAVTLKLIADAYESAERFCVTDFDASRKGSPEVLVAGLA